MVTTLPLAFTLEGVTVVPLEENIQFDASHKTFRLRLIRDV